MGPHPPLPATWGAEPPPGRDLPGPHPLRVPPFLHPFHPSVFLNPSLPLLDHSPYSKTSGKSGLPYLYLLASHAAPSSRLFLRRRPLFLPPHRSLSLMFVALCQWTGLNPYLCGPPCNIWSVTPSFKHCSLLGLCDTTQPSFSQMPIWSGQ